MNKLYFRYLASLYLKNCLIFIIAFVGFYLFIDLLINYKKLHINTNIFLLYILYTMLTAFYYILPIALILASIFTKISLIKKNEFIAFYSLGLSKNASVIPTLFISLIITFFAISLNYTNIAYAENYKSNILKYGYLSKEQMDLFFKYQDDYIYIKSYDKAKMHDIKIMKTQNNEISKIITAKTASFINNNWVLEDANITEFKLGNSFDDTYIINQKLDQEIILKDFKPEILDNLGTDDSSLKDAFFYLNNFESNKNIARASIYKQSIFLLYAPFFALIIFYNIPIMPRYNDLNIIALSYICLSLLVYGVLFLLLRFASNGAINPEIAILLPISIIIVYSLMKFNKNK
ncbi:lipooligosaccharide transport system, ABC transporter permease component LptG [Campylobacter sp. RM5004]|uniref:LptF/LptG family permease n=1 Tax=Campylobacter sp. RM5004 TaxID=1660078 RepID=UPI001EFAB19D|nr:LptF/LptG family permease [Campylobacter sp. RM5004]ULO01182.1 lipooligosaccharide transport system, ABC transporter permease component LptG [Campylobacter sp. RM5004]